MILEELLEFWIHHSAIDKAIHHNMWIQFRRLLDNPFYQCRYYEMEVVLEFMRRGITHNFYKNNEKSPNKKIYHDTKLELMLKERKIQNIFINSTDGIFDIKMLWMCNTAKNSKREIILTYLHNILRKQSKMAENKCKVYEGYVIKCMNKVTEKSKNL